MDVVLLHRRTTKYSLNWRLNWTWSSHFGVLLTFFLSTRVGIIYAIRWMFSLNFFPIDRFKIDFAIFFLLLFCYFSESTIDKKMFQMELIYLFLKFLQRTNAFCSAKQKKLTWNVNVNVMNTTTSCGSNGLLANNWANICVWRKKHNR